MLKDICGALLEADVNVKLVGALRKSIKSSVSVKDLAPGVNKKRLIQKVRKDGIIDWKRLLKWADRPSLMNW